MSVLIIDNDLLFLKNLQNAFEVQGYNVMTATNSLIASTLFFQHKPEAVILNVCMPDKDGFELIKEIRKFCKKTFILAVSTHDIYLRSIKKLGANEALSKAIKPEVIVAKFRRALLFSCLQANSFEKPKCEACGKTQLCGLKNIKISQLFV